MGLVILWHFDFNLGRLFVEASEIHPKGAAILAPGGLFAEPVSAISLGLALVFGTAGLPHILMRFFTVKDAAAARKSVFYATTCVAYFSLVIPLLGFGAVVILMPDSNYSTSARADSSTRSQISSVGRTWQRSTLRMR
jgi:cation/acetate symporter